MVAIASETLKCFEDPLCIFDAQGVKRRLSESVNSYRGSVAVQRFFLAFHHFSIPDLLMSQKKSNFVATNRQTYNHNHPCHD